MDSFDKAASVRSYVHAQLPFVPFYSTDILDPGDSLPEVFGLRTPILTARNPLVTIQPESNPPSASACLEDPRGGPARADPTLTQKPTKNQNKRLAKHPLEAKERKQRLRLRRDGQITPDPDSLSEPTKEHTPMRRERKTHRGKPRIPIGLSFFHGFAPKNVGPSRLTVSHLKTLLERRNTGTLTIFSY